MKTINVISTKAGGRMEKSLSSVISSVVEKSETTRSFDSALRASLKMTGNPVISTKAGGRMEKSFSSVISKPAVSQCRPRLTNSSKLDWIRLVVISTKARSAKSRNLFPAAIAALCLAAACTDLTIHDNAEGVTPEKGQSYIALCAEQCSDNIVNVVLNEGIGFTTVNLFVMVNKCSEEDVTISIQTEDEAFVVEYSEKIGINYKPLPKAFYKFIDGGTVVLRKGEVSSAPKQLRLFAQNPLENILLSGRYLLPLKISVYGKELENTVLYVDLEVRTPYTDPDGYPLYEGEDMFTVFYLNTSQFDPRLANDMVLMTDVFDDSKPQYGIGNIINLLKANVQIDDITGRVFVNPSLDLRYCLEHYTERILPVQESGRKVCITIEGSGKGLGFCNFDDTQITSFVASVSKLVNKYGLDGINLWDRNASYERAEENGFAPMNTTSYPKLIKALRENLGAHKLITITDYEEPTVYFHDVEACGGIEVGKYIDYAWSGYYDNCEPVQIVDPWNQGTSVVSILHPRQPISGLNPKRYGCIHATTTTWNMVNKDVIEEWFKRGMNPNGIIVYYEIRSIIQDKYESGGCNNPDYLLKFSYNSRCQYNISRLSNNAGTGPSKQYNKWIKDW